MVETSASGPATGFHVEVKPSHIRLLDSEEELAYWDRAEWVEDPSLVVAIANAINIGHRDGPDMIRRLLA